MQKSNLTIMDSIKNKEEIPEPTSNEKNSVSKVTKLNLILDALEDPVNHKLDFSRKGSSLDVNESALRLPTTNKEFLQNSPSNAMLVRTNSQVMERDQSMQSFQINSVETALTAKNTAHNLQRPQVINFHDRLPSIHQTVDTSQFRELKLHTPGMS